MFSIDDFENVIDPTIIGRGQDYYASGSVVDLIDDGDTWEAVVYGSYEYEVTVVLAGRTVTDIFCDCPYDYGPYCKHMVAVLFAIRANLSKSSGKRNKPGQRESVREVLAKLKLEQLIDIVMSQVKRDRSLANDILLKYSDATPDKGLYTRTIKQWMQDASDHGFLDYRASQRVGDRMAGVVEQAEEMIRDEQPSKAIPVLLAVIETADEALQNADDSSGSLSGAADIAFNAFDDLVQTIPDKQKRSLFNTFLEQAGKSTYSRTGLDYDWQFLRLAGDLVQTHADRETLFAIVDDKAAGLTGRYDRYRQEDAVFIKRSVMEAMGDSPEKIRQLLVVNVNLYRVRDALIDDLMADKDYDEVSRLAMEGIVQSKADSFPGLVQRYKDVLMEIAKKTGNITEALKMAEERFYESSHSRMVYYNQLRELVPNDEWPAYLERIIEHLKQEKSYSSRDMLRRIYVEEGRWDEVLQFAIQTRDFVLINQHRHVLFERYPEKIAMLYEREIYAMLERATGRNIYQEAVGYLRNLMMIDSEQRAFDIVDNLKKMYPKRRAMAEELSKL